MPHPRRWKSLDVASTPIRFGAGGARVTKVRSRIPRAVVAQPYGEQMKKYSTASFGLTNGIFMLTCVLIALRSLRSDMLCFQLCEAGKEAFIVKYDARLSRNSLSGWTLLKASYIRALR